MSVKRRIMVKAKLEEISAVDKPAQPDAKMVLRKRFEEQFEKLKPSAGESEKDFVSRFMSDERMKQEYPDEKQRVAVAMSMFSRPAKKNSDESIPADSSAPTHAGESQDNIMTPEQILVLQKRAERAEKALKLSGAEREIFLAKSEAEQDAFLQLSDEQRVVEVQKSATSNPVVYTDGKGRQFRKNDDPRMVELAKDADEARQARKDAEKVAKLDRIAKRAAELKHLPGEDADRVLLVEAVEKLEGEQQTKVFALLTNLDGQFAQAFVRKGTNAAPVTTSTAEQKIEVLAKALRAAKPNLTEAQAYVEAMNSPEGKAAYAEHLKG